MNTLMSSAVVTLGLLLAGGAQAGMCNNAYTVKGALKVYNDATNPEGAYEPVKGIKVRIYNGLFHIQTTYTKSDGTFNKTWDSCSSRLNLNLAFIPTTAKVNVSQLMLPDTHKIRPGKKFDGARAGTHDFGTLYYGKTDTDSGRILKVYHAMVTILDWLKTDHGIDFVNDPGTPTGHVEIGYPSLTPNDTSWYTPTTHLVNLKKSDFQPQTPDADVLVHEFGHLFQHGYGRWYLNIPDYNGDAGWSYSSEETPGVANLEGFATFFEYLFMEVHGFAGYGTAIEGNLNRDYLGAGGATNHAAFYYDLYDEKADADTDGNTDGCVIDLNEIMAVFAADDGIRAFSIAEDGMDEFVDKYYAILGTPPSGCDLEALLRLNHLQ